ncbi:MAG: AIR synthase related protein, partial [Ignavibacterium sp.]|nr:AIR synthase related protein [Ignavibacterium sp.]
PEPENLKDTFLKVFSSPNIVSKQWVYHQYDTMVRTNTIVGPGCDSAVIYIKGTNKALAMKTDCNARYVYLNPKEGTKIAVSECARNIVCSGAVPLGVTNCLNFGNPYKPEIYWQFAQAIAGMGEACRKFNTPVTGGNVSFYNESPDGAVYPTPTIGMVGLIEDLKHITTSYFKDEGDVIYLIGEDFEEIGGSEYLKVIYNKVAGDCPHINLDKEKKLQDVLLSLIRKGLIKSAHDISEGGIVSAIAECCIINQEKQIGCEVEIPVKSRKDFSLFSESQSRIIVTVSKENSEELEKNLELEPELELKKLGIVSGSSLKIKNLFEVELTLLSDIYYNTIPRIMSSEK